MDPLKTAPPQEARLHFLDYWRIIRIRKTVILAVFLLVVITATVVTLILPESYASTASIRIERDRSDIPELQNAAVGGYDPYFIATEFEVIQSQPILGKVTEDLNLNREWGKKYNPTGEPLHSDETMTILKGRMALRPVRNTSLIEITVYSDNMNEAAKLANAIAEAYQAYRLDERTKLTKGGLKALEDNWNDQQAKIRKAQDEVNTLREKFKVSDIAASSEAPAPIMEADTLRRFETLRIEGQAELASQETLYNKLKDLAGNPEKLAQAIPTSGIQQDSSLISLLEQLTLAEQRLVSLNKEYGPEHSEVKKVKSQVDDLHVKIQARVVGILAGLEIRVASLREHLGNLKTEVEKARQADLDKASESRPYWEKKRDLEELLQFNRVLEMKMASTKTDMGLPKLSVVSIVNHAIANPKPVRPNKPLNIALGVIIGLVVGVGLAFFIEYLDTSVKTIDDVERTLGAPVLGVIPQNVGLLLTEGGESPHAEAYRVLRTNLLFSRKDDKLNTVAVVSAGAGEGKSTTVFNLAVAFAQGGQRVLMVDSDLRRPALHKMLHLSNSVGLTSYLLKQNTLEEVIQTTSLATLDFMASGKLPSSSLGILSSSQMRNLVSELKQHYDFVFFDSPPIMGVSDASVLASEIDMTLQVIQYRRYPQPMNVRAKQMIEKVGGNLVGIVLNNINMSQDENYYYYSGYYHDYYSRSEDQEPATRASDKNKPEGKQTS